MSETEKIALNEKEHFFLLSAKTEKSLKKLMEKWSHSLELNDFLESSIEGICNDLLAKEKSFAHRFGVLVQNQEELKLALRKGLSKMESKESKKKKKKSFSPNSLIFQFGEISENDFSGMAEFCKQEPLFRKHFEYCKNKAVEVSEDDSVIISQVLLQNYYKAFNLSVSYGLARLYLSLGLEPSLVFGEKEDGYWGVLSFTEVISIEDCFCLLLEKKKTSEIKISRPKYPLYDPISHQIIYPYAMDMLYLKTLIQGLTSSVKEIKKKLEFYFQELERLPEKKEKKIMQHMESWNSALQKEGYKPSQLLQQETKVQGKKEKEKQLLALILLEEGFHSLNLNGTPSQFVAAHNGSLTEFLTLIKDNIFSKEHILSLVTKKESEYPSILEATKGKFLSLFPKKYPLLSEYNQSLKEIKNPEKWVSQVVYRGISEVKGAEGILFAIKDVLKGPEKENPVLKSVLNLWLSGASIKWNVYLAEKAIPEISLPTTRYEKKKAAYPKETPTDEEF